MGPLEIAENKWVSLAFLFHLYKWSYGPLVITGDLFSHLVDFLVGLSQNLT